jgi:hypothetical protein
MIKTLITNGDSWTFGSEIMAPEFCVENGKGTGMGRQYKEGHNDTDSANDYYRIPRIWPSFLAKQMGYNVVNLAQPARSNDTIYDTTIGYLLEHYISKGINTDDILVVIGWSSPERKNVILEDSDTDTVQWFTMWPSMVDTKFYHSYDAKVHSKYYVRKLWLEQEYIKRFVEQNYSLQNFLKQHNIKYYVFNAFYQTIGSRLDQWEDLNIRDTIVGWNKVSNGWTDTLYNWDTIKQSLLLQWDEIDKLSYINKEIPNGSFKGCIDKHIPLDIRMCNWHPSPASHEYWATFLYNWISSV